MLLTLCFPAVSLRLQAKCPAIAEPRIEVCITKTFQVWLRNNTEEDIQLSACELLGFGQGVCTDQPAGLAVEQSGMFNLP